MGNITILNIDRNRRTQAARTAVLAHAQFRVAEAADGRAALETLRRHANDPVLVLLRGAPPDMEAPEFCRAVRENAAAPVFVLRLLGPADRDEAPAPDADACLRDHFRRPEWLSTVGAFAGLMARQAADRRCLEGLQAELAERELTIERLRQEGEQRLHAAGEAAPVGTWWVDLETGLESRDAGVNRILGLPAEPSTAPVVTSTARIPPEDRPRIEAAFRRLNIEGGVYDEEFRILLPDGSIRWVRDRGHIVSDGGGRPIYATGALVDITERKKHEETIRQLDTRLRRKIDEFETLLEFAPLSIVVAEDPEGRRLRMNPAFARLAGVGSGSNPGFGDSPERRPKCRFLRNGRELARDELPLAIALRTGRPVEDFEIDIALPDGRVVNQLGHAVPLFDDEGRVRGGAAVSLDITSHKRAQQELLRQKEILRTIVENIPVMIDFVDAEGRFQFVNRCWTDTLGWSLEEARGRELFAEFYPDPGYRARVLDGIRNPRAGFADVEIRTRDGRTLQTSWANVKLSDGTGIGIGIDVTERRQAEAALKFDRALLDALQTAAPVGIAFVDRNFRYIRVNRAYAEITGFPVDRHVGRTVGEIVPGLWSLLETAYHSVLERGEVAANIEVAGETRAQPGVRRHWLANCYPLTVAGEIVAAGAVIQEITGQKRTEEALRESERRLELALAGADLGSWDWNLQTGEMLIDDRWARVFADAPEAIVTDYDGWLRGVHPEDRERVLEVLNAHVAGRLSFYEAEYRFLPPSGHWIWAMVRGRIVERDESGKPLRAVGMYRDISVRKALEERLEQQRDQILHVQRLATAGELVAMVAHELNQPLGAIANYLGGAILRFGNLLAAQPSLGEALNEALRLSRRAAQVVKSIRDLVRGRDRRREWVAIPGLIHDSLLLTQAEFRKRHIRLVLDVVPDLPPVWGQRVPLQQLLLNLALNAMEAMKSTPPSRRELRIQAGLTAEGEIELSVSDSGKGLPADLAPRLFEPFVTDKPEGIGLGLSICRTIVETHGGRIEADLPGEQGATFRIRLPAGSAGGT